MERKISLTPFKELRGGKDSIYDNIKNGYSVPSKVIAYLQTTNPYMMSPGIYEHPFKKDKRLLGPYLYTDGKYCWDRDTWKYVLKYGLTLPKDFIDHVMSDAGTEFIEKCKEEDPLWGKTIACWEQRDNFTSFLPTNDGDVDLSDF